MSLCIAAVKNAIVQFADTKSLGNTSIQIFGLLILVQLAELISRTWKGRPSTMRVKVETLGTVIAWVTTHITRRNRGVETGIQALTFTFSLTPGAQAEFGDTDCQIYPADANNLFYICFQSQPPTSEP